MGGSEAARDGDGGAGRELTPLDQRLLAEMQERFPLTVAPFRELAGRLGVAERDVIARVTAMRDAGIVRHVTPIFEAEALGYSSCLVAMRVAEERLPAAVEAVNGHPGVSHNYRRTHAFNLWFTISVPPGTDLRAHVDAVAALAGAESARALPTVRRFKIGVSLDVTGERPMDHTSKPRHTGAPKSAPGPREPLSQRDIAVIRAVQGDLPLRPDPFADAARAAGLTEEELVESLAGLQRRGCLRRMAVILRHREAGFQANGMAVWNVPDADVEAVGEAMAGYTAISHCYERPRYDDWPYNLFTMIHARSTAECDAFVEQLAARYGLSDYAVLYSTKEYKKVRPVYFTPDVANWEREHMPAGAHEG